MGPSLVGVLFRWSVMWSVIMQELLKQTVTARTESHSDVADTTPARAYQAATTERQFGEVLLRRVREARGEITVRGFREEWLPMDGGLIHELSVEVIASE